MKDMKVANTASAYAIARQMGIRGLTHVEFAYLVKIPVRIVEKILTGTIQITSIDAEKLEAATNIPAQFWVDGCAIVGTGKRCKTCGGK